MWGENFGKLATTIKVKQWNNEQDFHKKLCLINANIINIMMKLMIISSSSVQQQSLLITGCMFTHWPLGDFNEISVKWISGLSYWLMAKVSVIKWPSWECHLSDDQSTLVQVKAWCRQASHYLSQCWPRFMSPYGVTRPQWVNTLRPRQNVWHFPDDIFKCISWMKINAGVYTKFSSRLSKEPFPWLIQKFPCILIFKTGQPGCQLNLSEGSIRLDLTSGRPLM